MSEGVLRSFINRLQKHGVRQGVASAWLYLLFRSRFQSGIKKIVGERIQHQIALAPRYGYWPRIEDPRSFNEYVLRRKFCSDNQLFSVVEDKYAVREYVKSNVGDEYLTELYHVTSSPETIPFDELPNQFAVKLTRGSGYNKFIEDKANVDFEVIRSQIQGWSSHDFEASLSEYWHGQIEPKILVEEFINDTTYDYPLDYKFFVFHGAVEYIEVDHNRFSTHKRRFYDREWNAKDIRLIYPLAPIIEEPEALDEMVDVAETLGEDFDFIRVDLYQPDSDTVIFGEMTVAPESGLGWFSPKQFDFELGEYW